MAHKPKSDFTIAVKRLVSFRDNPDPRAWWETREIVLIPSIEVERDMTATQVFDWLENEFPFVPRAEFAIVGWPQERQLVGEEA